MYRFIRLTAFFLILSSLIILSSYCQDLVSTESVNSQLRVAKSQSMYESSRQPDRSETETTLQLNGERHETAADQPTDIFAPLRKQLPSYRLSPLYDLFMENNDLVGWIKIPGTRIDYPIVKSTDNDFYLKHDFYGQPSKAGSIFMDYRNIGDFSDRHTIIYGHKIKNKTMFYDLLRFRDPEFYQESRILVLETLRGKLYYKVFAAYTTGPDFYFIETRFKDRSYTSFIQEIKKRSDHDWDTAVYSTSKILTLATCSHDFQDSRYVVHAVFIEDVAELDLFGDLFTQ